jgi:hypothetical protein
MIVHYIGGNDLQEAEDDTWILRAEVLEQTAVVRTELQVSFLYQVIEKAGKRFTPLSRRPQGNGRNQRMKAPDEFGPHHLVPSRNASRDELVRG